jgi:hypothetical protein
MNGPERPCWSDVVCVAAAQLSSCVGDETAILAVDKGAYYGLDPVGTRIWTLLQSPVSVHEIGAAVVREYDVDEETARADLLALLARLHEAGLIDVRRAGTA